jgi:hypothetical protein
VISESPNDPQPDAVPENERTGDEPNPSGATQNRDSVKQAGEVNALDGADSEAPVTPDDDRKRREPWQ